MTTFELDIDIAPRFLGTIVEADETVVGRDDIAEEDGDYGNCDEHIDFTLN